MAFTATESELERYNRKAALGQAEVVAVSEEDITLIYHRFDSDTGERIADEVTPVDYAAITAERDAVAAEVAAGEERLATLDAVLGYLDGLLGG